jgi:sulfur relay protein TusB/DsrH
MQKILVIIDDNELKALAYECISTLNADESGILFIHNGAFLPILLPDKNKIEEFIKNGIPLFGIFRDFMLRGIEAKVGNQVQLLDYNEFIKLIMEEYNKVLSFL